MYWRWYNGRVRIVVVLCDDEDDKLAMANKKLIYGPKDTGCVALVVRFIRYGKPGTADSL